MTCLYELEIHAFYNGEDFERYGIGIFRNKKDAEKAAKRYLKDVRGFRDYYCEYTITEHELVGDPLSAHAYSYFGWNSDDQGNEYDIVSGLMYADMEAAEVAMETVKDAYERQEWALRQWEIGKCEWAEGFVRESPEGAAIPTLPELRQQLRQLSDTRQHCGIEYAYAEDVQNAFPLAVGENLFLAAVDDVFLLNGFTVRRLRDIRHIRQRNGLYQSIAEKEGLNIIKVPDVELTNWKSVFISLQWLDKPVIIEREYEPSFFRLGRIENVKRDRVLIRYFTADGTWQEPVEIPFQGITSVTFDDRYSSVFSKYV